MDKKDKVILGILIAIIAVLQAYLIYQRVVYPDHTRFRIFINNWQYVITCLLAFGGIIYLVNFRRN